MAAYLIVNADDFGASAGINRAVADCHERGVLTSASLMVDGAAAAEAAALTRRLPRLSVGLHFDVLGEGLEESFDLTDHARVAAEYARQLAAFEALTGRPPTHVDSHRHAHRRAGLFPLFRELVAPLGVPLRGDGRVRFAGGFYGQADWMVPDPELVSVVAFGRLLAEHAGPGWLELGCHPGYPDPAFRSVYDAERAVEVATLTDPSLSAAVAVAGFTLASYHDLASAPEGQS